MRGATRTATALAVVVAAAFAFAQSIPHWFVPKVAAIPELDLHDPELIARGEYFARVANCVACHTAPDGEPFAGGLSMQTPLGAIYSTNITPDTDTGIGSYSYADFERAVRRGVRPDNVPLYPAMPFVSYRIIEDEEIEAMYAYFMSGVEAVVQKNPAPTIPWPASMRWPLFLWQLLFAQPREFEPADHRTEQENHGAYLVEGPAHCGSCHTPRGLALQETALADDDTRQFLAGAVLEGWYAKSLRDEGIGLSTWSKEEIVDFLRTGRTDHTAAFGTMTNVIEHSTQYLTDDDLAAIAAYLKTLPSRRTYNDSWQPAEDFTTAQLRDGAFSTPGALIYVQECAACHRLDGMGAPRVFPALAHNSIVFADNPSSLIQVTLAGSRMPDTSHDAMTFAMPAFYHLSNRDLADVLNFIRTGWGNHGSEITVRDIARMRRLVDNAPQDYVPTAQEAVHE